MEISIGSLVSFRLKLQNSIFYPAKTNYCFDKENFGLVVGVAGTDPLGKTLYNVMTNENVIVLVWNDDIIKRE